MGGGGRRLGAPLTQRGPARGGAPAPSPAEAAQILARAELASACSSWMGVRQLLPPGEEEGVRGER